MRNNQELAMRRYAEAARAHYDSHPEDEAALHEAHLDSLGLDHDAKQYIVEHKLPEVAAHLAGHSDDLRAVKEGNHMEEVKKLREKLAGGNASEEADQNEKTAKYLGDRNKRSSDRFAEMRRR